MDVVFVTFSLVGVIMHKPLKHCMHTYYIGFFLLGPFACQECFALLRKQPLGHAETPGAVQKVASNAAIGRLHSWEFPVK